MVDFELKYQKQTDLDLDSKKSNLLRPFLSTLPFRH